MVAIKNRINDERIKSRSTDKVSLECSKSQTKYKGNSFDLTPYDSNEVQILANSNPTRQTDANTNNSISTDGTKDKGIQPLRVSSVYGMKSSTRKYSSTLIGNKPGSAFYSPSKPELASLENHQLPGAPLYTPSPPDSRKNTKRLKSRLEKQGLGTRIHRSFWSVPVKNFPISPSCPSPGTTATVTTVTLNTSPGYPSPDYPSPGCCPGLSTTVQYKILDIEEKNNTVLEERRCRQNPSTYIKSPPCHRRKIQNIQRSKSGTNIEHHTMEASLMNIDESDKIVMTFDDGGTVDGASCSSSQLSSYRSKRIDRDNDNISQRLDEIETGGTNNLSQKSKGVKIIISDPPQQSTETERDIDEPPELKRYVPSSSSSQIRINHNFQDKKQDPSLLLNNILRGYVKRGEPCSRLEKTSKVGAMESKINSCDDSGDESVCTGQLTCTSISSSDRKRAQDVLRYSGLMVDPNGNTSSNVGESNTSSLIQREEHPASYSNITGTYVAATLGGSDVVSLKSEPVSFSTNSDSSDTDSSDADSSDTKFSDTGSSDTDSSDTDLTSCKGSSRDDLQSESSSLFSKRYANATLKTASACASDTSFIEIVSDDEASCIYLSTHAKENRSCVSTDSGLMSFSSKQAEAVSNTSNTQGNHEEYLETATNRSTVSTKFEEEKPSSRRYDVSPISSPSSHSIASSSKRLEAERNTCKTPLHLENQNQVCKSMSPKPKENKLTSDVYNIPQIEIDVSGKSKPFIYNVFQTDSDDEKEMVDKCKIQSHLDRCKKARNVYNVTMNNRIMATKLKEESSVGDSVTVNMKLKLVPHNSQQKSGEVGEVVGHSSTNLIDKRIEVLKKSRANNTVPLKKSSTKSVDKASKVEEQERTEDFKKKGGFRLRTKMFKRIAKNFQYRTSKHQFHRVDSDKEILLPISGDEDKVGYSTISPDLSSGITPLSRASKLQSEGNKQTCMTSNLISDPPHSIKPLNGTYQSECAHTNNASNKCTNIPRQRNCKGLSDQGETTCSSLTDSINPLYSVEGHILPTCLDAGFLFDSKGVNLYEMKDYKKALSYFKDCLTIQCKIDSKNAATGRMLNNRGCAEYGVGYCKKALASFQESLSAFKIEADTNDAFDPNLLFQESIALCNIGHIYLNERKFNAAVAVYHQCLDVQKMFLGLDHTFLELTKNHFNFANRKKLSKDSSTATYQKYIPASGFALFGGR